MASSSAAEAIAEQALQALPPDIRDLITKPGKVSDRVNAAIRWAAKPDASVVERHHRRNRAIVTFADIPNARLRDMDVVARQIARQFRRRAALTGAVSGLPGGIWALIAAGADVQLTAIYAVRMVADIAQAYGYDTSLVEEQAELADVLAVAAGVDSLRGVGTFLSRSELTHLLPRVLPRLLARMGAKITQEQAAKWVGRLIPGLGAVVGAGIDYTFLRVAGHRALEHYHARYIGAHTLAAPAGATVAALPPAPGVEAGAAPGDLDGAMPADAGAGVSLPAAAPARPVAAAPMRVPAPLPDVATPQRSATLAVLLEILVPGAGALYAGHMAMGVLWFLLSVAAAYVVGLTSGLFTALGQSQSVDLTTLPGWLLYVGIGAALWLILRAVVAVGYARGYAATHAARPPEHFATRLGAFALIFFVGTIGVCAGLVYLIYTAIASLIHG
jgi:hypothetical protein